MQKNGWLSLGCVWVLSVQTAQAAITLDRTRAIYDGSARSISLNITNENKQQPYLAQAWLEGATNKKTHVLMVVQPVQRLEAGGNSMVRSTATPDTARLPQDRESLFYFNLREIPPRSSEPNVMQIALQTKIKFFYRPAAIAPEQMPGDTRLSLRAYLQADKGSIEQRSIKEGTFSTITYHLHAKLQLIAQTARRQIRNGIRRLMIGGYLHADRFFPFDAF